MTCKDDTSDDYLRSGAAIKVIMSRRRRGITTAGRLYRTLTERNGILHACGGIRVERVEYNKLNMFKVILSVL